MAIALLPIAGLSAATTAAGSPTPSPTTPALIERAVQRGELDRHTADLYLVAAIRGEPIPPAYASDTPFRATMPLLQVTERLERMEPGPERRSLRRALHPVGTVGTDECGGAATPLPNTLETPHFYIEYNATAIGGGLTIADYESVLETAWTREVDQFGWAPPPVYPPNPAPGTPSKYPVRIENLGPTTYGFVANSGTHAGPVGNNPATAWNEGDASASCMVLNSNFGLFPGEPLAALQATTAHEFNHSIQFGWGVLAGITPDLTFVEGLATWIEDEVFDESNDNYNFLWPEFQDDMGQYLDSALDSPYEYWITFRGLTEPHGTGVPGGGEDIIQRFWELISRNEQDSLEALDTGLSARGSSLPGAYHSYAIAVRFAKGCGGGFQPPHCLEEGPGYMAAKGPNASHGTVSMNATFSGGLLDNYALNWIDLPQSTDFQVALENPSNGGRFRASVACDTGTGFVITPFTGVVEAGETQYVRAWNGAACATPIAVITNVTQTAANPSSSDLRPYRLSVGPPPQPSNLSVRGRLSGRRVIATGKLAPDAGGDKVEVTLFRKAKGWREVQARSVNVAGGGSFRTRFRAPDTKRCKFEAAFEGDLDRLPSSATKAFRC